ncbi:Pentatricopeptide repeat-containing protein [Vitis vinifera]|uniref:Pentatricopeptide repeat-containing protein n=1 Tax=Vitis vinifera TaxID=29760 RepID=A0A438C564_VITVI|nr:Pentatricopeptide repeat-containing protein [Vitis vinifera]
MTWFGLLVHTHVVKSGFECDSYIVSSLIHLYANGKDLVAAKQLFNLCSDRDLVSWNAMIDGYVKRGEMGHARIVFDRMVCRDVISWNTMINGYAIVGKIDEAKRLFDEMPERNLVSWNSMLAGFVKCGNVEDAFGLFSEMPCRDVVSWNSMLACYAQCGKPNEVLALFDQMRAVGVKPTEATVVSLLSACAHLGALDKGYRCLDRTSTDTRPDIDREKNPLDREEKAIGRERNFLASLDRSSTGRAQPVDWFLNQLSQLAITSIG